MSDYVHGFSKKEQRRLLYQARFLEPYLHAGIVLPKAGHLLEVGCGVGAQTQILLNKYPRLKIQGVDQSAVQLAAAQKTLKKYIQSGRVKLHQASAETLDLPKKDFSAAFLCWILEHVPDPLAVLKRTREHLKSGATIVCTEPFHQSLYLEPYAPNFLEYWRQFNDLQWEMRGHPNMGVGLGNLLGQAGYRNIAVVPVPLHFDSRNFKLRSSFADYFLEILLSAQERLVAGRRVTPKIVRQMKDEFSAVGKSKNGIFYYSFVRATAKV